MCYLRFRICSPSCHRPVLCHIFSGPIENYSNIDFITCIHIIRLHPLGASICVKSVVIWTTIVDIPNSMLFRSVHGIITIIVIPSICAILPDMSTNIYSLRCTCVCHLENMFGAAITKRIINCVFFLVSKHKEVI